MLGELLDVELDKRPSLTLRSGFNATLAFDQVSATIDCYRSSRDYMNPEKVDFYEKVYEGFNTFCEESKPTLPEEWDQFPEEETRNKIFKKMCNGKEQAMAFLKAEIGFFTEGNFKDALKEVILQGTEDAKRLEKKKVTIAIPFINSGGATKECNHGWTQALSKYSSRKFGHLFCKSSLWVLAHSYSYLKEAKEKIGEFEFLFYGPEVPETHFSDTNNEDAVVWNLNDASYSGTEALMLTNWWDNVDVRTLIAIGRKHDHLPMCTGAANQDRCIIFGQTWEPPKKQVLPERDTSSHFFVQWKAADQQSTGNVCEIGNRYIGQDAATYKRNHAKLTLNDGK
jgi:hypothetical protein